MKFATLNNTTPDGQLVLVSSDLSHFVPIKGHSLLSLIEAGNGQEELVALLADLDTGKCVNAKVFDMSATRAPLPRTWQWLDGSAFAQHGVLMQKAFNLPPIETDRPLMYQGMSDRFYGPCDDVPFLRESDGIDFEGEFGVIVDFVPMGTNAGDAMKHIKLIVQINDWSLRAIAPIEMKTGFGWVQAKPACSMAPLAVTPDELGDAWKNGRACLDLNVRLNGDELGRANGSEMDFGFHELVAHAAHSRDLVAGTIIGSGTVSSKNYTEIGSSCLSERRAIDMIDFGEIRTQFMSFGDRVEMDATLDGQSVFGSINQIVTSKQK